MCLCIGLRAGKQQINESALIIFLCASVINLMRMGLSGWDWVKGLFLLKAFGVLCWFANLEQHSSTWFKKKKNLPLFSVMSNVKMKFYNIFKKNLVQH